MSLTVTLRQRALVSARMRSDPVQTTLDHIPGSVVRGAFAAAWLAEHGGSADSDRDQFLRLFEGGVRYGPLFTGRPPTPLSIMTHKYRYQTGGQACADLEFDESLTGDAPPHCQTCGVPLEPATGARDPGSTERRTSVSIGPSGVAARGQLVTRETLSPRQAFRGNLVATEPALLERLAGLGPIRVGGRRTTHGSAEIAVDDAAPELPERLPDGRVVLRLRSPGIFVDDWGRPSRDPNAGELAELAGSAVTVHRRWYRWATVPGWHAASDLPKPSELAVAAGSTYLISAAGGIGDDTLATLAARGIGLRRCEGFGDLGGPFGLDKGTRALSEVASQDAAQARALAKHIGLNTRELSGAMAPLTAYVRGEITNLQLFEQIRIPSEKVERTVRKLPRRHGSPEAGQ
jgi:CRISPR-associated protein Csx10